MAAKAPEEEYGGYDYEFVEKVPDRFVCNICTKVQRDPRLTLCCGQHFCQSCLENWLKKHGKKSCPHCREKKDFNHVLNKAQKREIGELKIHCTLRQEGCQWVGELDSLQTHLNSNRGCGYVDVRCTNKCGVTMKRKDLKGHVADSCPLRRYKCQHCNHVDTYQAITGQHYGTCPNYPLPCPNKCGENNMKRKYMSAHRLICPLEVVNCPYKCLLKMKRKDLKQHLTEECPLRRYKCEHCGHEDTHQAITGEGYHTSDKATSHYDTCPSYPIPCPNKCSENNIKRTNMSAHRLMCPLEVVNCTNRCLLKMKRKYLKQHLTEQCRLRRYKCEHCGHEDTHQAITGESYHTSDKATSHYDTCPSYPIPCPNKKCSESSIERKDMSAHREKCPEEPVKCPFKEAGCTAKLVRRELDSHVANNQQMHILVLMRAFSQSRAELESELDTTRKVIATDVKILHENKQPQASIALESIQSQAAARLTRGEPLTIRMPNFSQYWQSGKVWHSPPFYYRDGYKMRLAVYANGTGAGVGTHVSVSLLLLRGKFDDRLTWPTSGLGEDIMIQLLAQKQKAAAGIQVEPSMTISLYRRYMYSPAAILRRVPAGENSWVVGSKEKFADHQTVQQYNLLHDSIVLKVTCM